MLYCSLQDSNPRLPICSSVLPLFTPYERMNRLYSSNLKPQVTVVMIIFERSRASIIEAHEKWKRCDWWGWRDSNAHCTNFEFVASCLLGYILIYCWRIPNPTSNSVTDRSPFPINPTIFNVDALMSFSFFHARFYVCVSLARKVLRFNQFSTPRLGVASCGR